MRAALDSLFLKAASLGLAVLLWYVIAGEKTSEMGLTVPVELQNFPKDLELTGEPVNTVEVRLRAAPGIIQGLGPVDVSALVDVAGAAEGERIVHLRPESIRIPFGVRVVKVNPSIITLNFERTLQKVVPVHPRLIGRPAPGHEVADVTPDPAEVRIAGPKTRVLEVESAFTEPVSIQGATATVVDTVNLGIEDPLLRIQGSPQVRVTARIREAHQKRTLAALPIGVRGGTATVRPATVKVVIEGPASVVARLTADDVRPYVDVAGLAAVARAPVTVELASGLTGVSVHETEPAEVQVRPGSRRRP